MADQKKNTEKTSSKKASPAVKPTATATKAAGKNGKGDAPRNCFSDEYRGNFDAIDWSK